VEIIDKDKDSLSQAFSIRLHANPFKTICVHDILSYITSCPCAKGTQSSMIVFKKTAFGPSYMVRVSFVFKAATRAMQTITIFIYYEKEFPFDYFTHEYCQNPQGYPLESNDEVLGSCDVTKYKNSIQAFKDFNCKTSLDSQFLF